MRRNLTETLERRKDDMIAALWSNSNWDDDKDSRKNAVAEIESNYQEAVSMIMGVGQPAEAEIQKDNPFFSAAERGIEKINAPRNDEGTVKEAVTDLSDLEIDQ